MPAPFQSTYSENQDVGLVGGLVNGEEFNALSRTVETAAGIKWGVPVSRGSADRGCVIHAAGLSLLGITRRNPAVVPGFEGYRQYAEAGIVDMGVINVKCEGTITAGAAAYWNPVSGLWTVVTASMLPIAGAKFDAAGGASVNNGLVPLRIRLT